MCVCLFVLSPSSPIPSRPIPIDRARWEKKNDTKIMGVPFKENFLAPYHVLRKSYSWNLMMSIKKLSWPSGKDCWLVEIVLKFDSQQNPKDFAPDKENLKRLKNGLKF